MISIVVISVEVLSWMTTPTPAIHPASARSFQDALTKVAMVKKEFGLE